MLRPGLGGASPSRGQFTDMVQEDRPLQGVELRGVSRNLGEERVGHQNGRLVAVAGGGVAQQGGDIHLESLGETIERGKGRDCLAILDLRDVGPWHVHACGKLALREVAHVAQIANGSGHLEAFAGGACLWDECNGGGRRFGLLDLEAFVAAAAQCICGAELYQAAVVTA